MGFYIQDDYIDSMTDMNKAEQNAFLGALFRLYMTGANEAGSIKSKVVRAALNSCKGRVLSARKEAEKKALQRKDKPEDETGTDTGTNEGTNPGTNTGTVHIKEGEGEIEGVVEGDREVEKNDVVVPIAVYEGGEIVSEPEGFAHFLAESLKAFNAATGQNWMGVTAASRQGMLEAFKVGRTLDDVNRVMDDVATWEPRYQTLNGVWAGGKFEQHINRLDAMGGGARRDFSEYDYLAR